MPGPHSIPSRHTALKQLWCQSTLMRYQRGVPAWSAFIVVVLNFKMHDLSMLKDHVLALWRQDVPRDTGHAKYVFFGI